MSSSSSGCVISYVQSAFNVGSTSIVATFANPVTSGNSIVVAVSTYNTATATVTDTLGNNYTQIGSVYSAPNGISLFIAYNTSGGSCTVTASSGPYIGLGIHEYTPIAGVDMVVSNSGSSNTPSPGTIMVSGSGEMCFAACAQGAFNQVGATLVNNGFTIRVDEPDGAAYESLATADLSPTGSNQTPTFTLSSSAAWAAIGVSFFCGAHASSSVSAPSVSSSSSSSLVLSSSVSVSSSLVSSYSASVSSSSVIPISSSSSMPGCYIQTNCAACPGGIASQWTMTISIAAGSCAYGSGTFLFISAGNCFSYNSTAMTINGAAPLWTWTYSVSGVYLTLSNSGGPTENADLEYYITNFSNFNCLGTNVFQILSSNCTESVPSTATIVPLCGGSFASASASSMVSSMASSMLSSSSTHTTTSSASSGGAGTSSTASSGVSGGGGGPACTPCGGSTPSTMSFTFSGATGAGCTSSNGSFTLNNTTLGTDCNFNDSGNIWNCYYAGGTTWYLLSTASFYYSCNSFSCTTGGTFGYAGNFGSCNGGGPTGLPPHVTVNIP